MFLQITHRHPEEDRKSIISERPKATLFFFYPEEIFLLLLQLHQSFPAEELRDLWLCLRSVITLEAMPALRSFIPIMVRQHVS